MGRAEYLFFGGLLLAALIALILGANSDPAQREEITKNRIDLITLDNGVECAVVKGRYSDNAISCNWNKN
jgi:hypothetical protein